MNLTSEQKKNAIEALIIEVNAGLVDDETCVHRMDELGITEDELDEAMNPRKENTGG